MAWRFRRRTEACNQQISPICWEQPEGAPALDSTHDPAYCTQHHQVMLSRYTGRRFTALDVPRRGAPILRQGPSASVPLAPPDGANSLRFWPMSIRPELPYPSRQPLMGNGTSNTGPADALPVAHRWLRTRMETRCTKHPASLSPGHPRRGCVGTVLKAVMLRPHGHMGASQALWFPGRAPWPWLHGMI